MYECFFLLFLSLIFHGIQKVVAVDSTYLSLSQNLGLCKRGVLLVKVVDNAKLLEEVP